MSYQHSRASLVAAVQFRLNDARGGTTEARWTALQIDDALQEAIRMADPIGYDLTVTYTYPNGTTTDSNGATVTLSTMQILDVLKVETFTAGKRSLLQPGQWTVDRSYTTFLTFNSPPTAGETVRIALRALVEPDATVIQIDATMLIEYTLSVLYERYVVYGGESSTLADTQRAQTHKIAGDTRKLLLMQQQYPNLLPAQTQARPAASGS